MPLQRRLPKFGFTNLKRVEFKAINLSTLEELASKKSILIGSKIDEDGTEERFQELRKKYGGSMRVLPLSIYMDDTVDEVRKALLELSGEKKEDGFTSRMDTDAHYRDEA